MKAKLTVWFLDESDENRREILQAVQDVTTDRESIVHTVDEENRTCHVVEFTMATMTQRAAVDMIDKSLRFNAWNKDTSTISFPKEIG